MKDSIIHTRMSRVNIAFDVGNRSTFSMKRIARARSSHQSQRRVRFKDLRGLIHTLSDAGAGESVLQAIADRPSK